MGLPVSEKRRAYMREWKKQPHVRERRLAERRAWYAKDKAHAKAIVDKSKAKHRDTVAATAKA